MPYQLNLSPLSGNWVETTNNGITYDGPHGNMGCPTHRQNKPFERQNEPQRMLVSHQLVDLIRVLTGCLGEPILP